MASTLTAGLAAAAAQNDPLWQFRQMSRYAPEAFALAAQMLAPNYARGSGLESVLGPYALHPAIGAALERAGGLMYETHPGMTEQAYREALANIKTEAQGARSTLAGQMSAFSGSLDPEAFIRAAQAITRGQLGAVSELQTRRAEADRAAIMQAVQALSPYAQMEIGRQREFQEDLNQLAGNILRSGTYTVRSRPTARWVGATGSPISPSYEFGVGSPWSTMYRG